MSRTIEQLRNELENLKLRIADIEDDIENSVADPVRTFDVVLRVTTRASTWGDDYVGARELENHFNQFIREIQSLTRLNDPGDSIIVQGVEEVTKTNGNDT